MASTPWSNYLVIFCGLWLLASPFSFGYDNSWMRLSDIGTGALVILFSSFSLIFRRDWPKWINCALGLWVTFAPVAFWSKNAAAYASGNLVGTLIVLSAIVIPSLLEKEDTLSSVPPGWNYNPSAWSQRILIIGLAFIGFLLAKYLAAYQLGHISTVWDPFFGEGTKNILESDVSRAFPVSDAGLGAWSYLLDALFGVYGSEKRWRTHPWVVILFGLMVIPPGVTSIILVVLQPIAVGSWCTICLATAVVMLLMVPTAIDEVVATVQYLRQSKRQGRSLWATFWRGGEPINRAPTNVLPARHGASSVFALLPWTLVVSTLVGLWLMVSPALFGATAMASNSNHLLGALIATFAVVAMAQVARPVRFVNVLLGAALAIGIWFLPGGALGFHWNSTLAGLLLIFLSMPLGQIPDRFGSYDRVIGWSPGKRKVSALETKDRTAA